MLDNLDMRMEIAFLIVVIVALIQVPTIFIADLFRVLLLIFYSLFVLLMLLYAAVGMGGRSLRQYSKAFNFSFLAFLAMFIIFVSTYAFSYPYISSFQLIYTINSMDLFFFLVLILFSLFSGIIYLNFVKKQHGIKTILLVLVSIIVLATAIYEANNQLPITDEDVLNFHAYESLINGTNPYTMNVSNLMYNEAQQIGFPPTVTTNNYVVGNLGYPSGSFLFFVPFYLLTRPSVVNLIFDHEIEVIILGIIFMFVLIFLSDRKKLLEPKIMLSLCFSGVLTVGVVSGTNFLVLILLILAYYKIDSKFLGILLGLVASIQEIFWLPIVMFILYSFNTYGLKRGFLNLIIASGVFFLFNGYFILLNPVAYFNAVFGMLNAAILSFHIGTPFASLILHYYPVPLETFSLVYLLVGAALVLASLYFNNKKLIILFNVIPIMFMFRPREYYFFFCLIFVAMLTMESKPDPVGWIRETVQKSYKLRFAFAGLLILVILSTIIVLYAAHLNYLKNFNFEVTNQQVYAYGNYSSYYTHYTADIYYNYSPSLAKRVYVLFAVYQYGDYGLRISGLYNQTLFNNSKTCSYPCSVNINWITINPSSNVYHLNITLPGTPLPLESIWLYNSTYGRIYDFIPYKNSSIVD